MNEHDRGWVCWFLVLMQIGFSLTAMGIHWHQIPVMTKEMVFIGVALLVYFLIVWKKPEKAMMVGLTTSVAFVVAFFDLVLSIK